MYLDTYDKGKQDTLVEESMDMSDEEAKIGGEDKEEKPLLPPEVFEHLKAAPTEDKKGEKSHTGRMEQKSINLLQYNSPTIKVLFFCGGTKT